MKKHTLFYLTSVLLIIPGCFANIVINVEQHVNMPSSGCNGHNCGAPEIDPCDTVECDVNAECSIGVCTCNPGYTGNGTACIDLCEVPDYCDVNANCTSGGVCICDPGYTGDGFNCTDLCDTPNYCDVDATCSPGGICACNAGYTGDGFACVDLCDLTTCDINAQCSMGICTCDAGYTGDGTTCTDLCDTPNYCDVDATCSPGGICACNAGYTGDGFTCDSFCDASPSCDTNAICPDIGVCTTCRPGYTGDGASCNAICDTRACGITAPCSVFDCECDEDKYTVDNAICDENEYAIIEDGSGSANYTNSLRKTWALLGRPELNFRLTWLYFELEDYFDYVYVRDYHTGQDLSSKLTGVQTLAPMTFSNTDILVYFYTDYSVLHHGFEINVTMYNPCDECHANADCTNKICSCQSGYTGDGYTCDP